MPLLILPDISYLLALYCLYIYLNRFENIYINYNYVFELHLKLFQIFSFYFNSPESLSNILSMILNLNLEHIKKLIKQIYNSDTSFDELTNTLFKELY